MAIYMWREWPDYLCFTANTAGSTVQLKKNWSPTSTFTLETSTDWNTRTTYTIGNTITLSNIWDKVYMRNKSETVTGFSTSTGAYYKFVMSWGIAASWDVNCLLCKNSTDTLSNCCFFGLFEWCSSLTSVPKLPATTLAEWCYMYMFYSCTWITATPELSATTLAGYCYREMFYNCTNLISITSLPATTLTDQCYYSMFQFCTKIKLSTTQTWEYQTAYRIPTTWTGTDGSSSLTCMFQSTWWTFASTPTINTTYYTSNTIV